MIGVLKSQTILSDDPTFTNDYKIEYNCSKEWLNTLNKNNGEK